MDGGLGNRWTDEKPSYIDQWGNFLKRRKRMSELRGNCPSCGASPVSQNSRVRALRIYRQTHSRPAQGPEGAVPPCLSAVLSSASFPNKDAEGNNRRDPTR